MREAVEILQGLLVVVAFLKHDIAATGFRDGRLSRGVIGVPGGAVEYPNGLEMHGEAFRNQVTGVGEPDPCGNVSRDGQRLSSRLYRWHLNRSRRAISNKTHAVAYWPKNQVDRGDSVVTLAQDPYRTILFVEEQRPYRRFLAILYAPASIVNPVSSRIPAAPVTGTCGVWHEPPYGTPGQPSLP